MGFIKMKDWEEWQSYRSDRGAPPWIKVHRNLLSNQKWAALSDEEKGQLISMWVVAADNNGLIPDEPRVIRKICQLDNEPRVDRFKELGWVVPVGCHLDANLTPSVRQPDAPEAEAEAEADKETDKKKKQSKFQNHQGLSLKEVFPMGHVPLDWLTVGKAMMKCSIEEAEKMGKKFYWYYTEGYGKDERREDEGLWSECFTSGWCRKGGLRKIKQMNGRE